MFVNYFNVLLDFIMCYAIYNRYWWVIKVAGGLLADLGYIYGVVFTEKALDKVQ